MTDYMKVSRLEEISSVTDTDLFDVSQDIGGGDFESKKIQASNLLGVAKTGTLGFSTNSTTVITPGVKGYVVIPYNGTIVGWYIVGNPEGSVVVDIWKTSGGIPTVANSITSDQKPSISSSNYASGSTIEHWVSTVSTGDVVSFNVDSCSGFTHLTLTVVIKKQ